jgi:hypothetical protein
MGRLYEGYFVLILFIYMTKITREQLKEIIREVIAEVKKYRPKVQKNKPSKNKLQKNKFRKPKKIREDEEEK